MLNANTADPIVRLGRNFPGNSDIVRQGWEVVAPEAIQTSPDAAQMSFRAKRGVFLGGNLRRRTITVTSALVLFTSQALRFCFWPLYLSLLSVTAFGFPTTTAAMTNR